MIDHLNAFALAVRDVKKCAEFYRDKLGFQLEVLESDFAYLTFGEKPGPGLALVSFDGFANEIVKESWIEAGDQLKLFRGFCRRHGPRVSGAQRKRCPIRNAPVNTVLGTTLDLLRRP